MPAYIEAGTWQGQQLRRARKAGRCDYWMGRQGRCPVRIEVGDQYFDGEMSAFKAGGWGCDRYCMAHAKDGLK